MLPTGFTLKISSPLFGNKSFTTRSFHDEINTWEQEHALDRGIYASARFELAIPDEDIPFWLEYGLPAHVEAFAPTGARIGQYFINELTVNRGGRSIRRGPLTDIANRVSVEYTPYIDITVPEPPVGDATVTTIAQDDDSIAKYGSIEKMFSHGSLVDDATYIGGGAPFNEAEAIRDAYLEDKKYPITEINATFDVKDANTVLQLECLGYGFCLDFFIYDNAFDHTITIPEKIIAILTANPNTVLGTNYDDINDDAVYLQLTPDGAEGFSTGWEIIDEMVAQGDANDNRTVFLILDGLKPYYNAIPATIDYHTNAFDVNQEIYEGGKLVAPWDIRPGKWLIFTDFSLGRRLPTIPNRDDPSMMFIESVSFRAPNEVEVRGQRASKLPQLLKKINFQV
jgi:hypothetical protein